MRTLMIIGGVAPTIDFYQKIVTEHVPECVIAVDSGLFFMHEYHIEPDYIIGDFDSSDKDIVYSYQQCSTIIQLDAEKDETDTQIAIRKACEIGTTELIILGALGNRLDHTIGNIRLILEAKQLGLQACIKDEHQSVYVIEKYHELVGQKGKTISLLAMNDIVTGVNLDGFYYPLVDATLMLSDVIGLSNVVISDHAGITITNGNLLLIINEQEI